MPLEAPTAERPLQTAVWRPICDSISLKAFRAEKQAIRRTHGGRKSVTRWGPALRREALVCSESLGGEGAVKFVKACALGLESIVSKRKGTFYRQVSVKPCANVS
jgi:hypothetical protein